MSAKPRLLPEPMVRLASVFCGCGEPETAWQWVVNYLSVRLARTASTAERPAAPNPCPETGAEWVAVYLLDHLGLTEHGSNIGLCWPTADGEAVLAFLTEHGCDWDEKGPWVDGEGNSWGLPPGHEERS